VPDSTAVPAAPDFDLQSGKAALELLAPYLAALSPDELLDPRTDPAAAAIKALGVAKAITSDQKKLFLQLPKQLFEHSLLELLEPAAFAVLFTRGKLEVVRAADRSARMPLGLIEQSTGLRDEMLQVLEYHLGTDPDGEHAEDSRKLIHIRQGSGHLDLSNDLFGLSALYLEHHDLLAGDTRRYRADDAAEAEQLAATIQDLLGEKRAARDSEDLQIARRAWTFLLKTYEEIAATGRWLMRNDEGAAERCFPRLGHGSRRRKQPVQPVVPPAPAPAVE
jgi:hypothetical protein